MNNDELKKKIVDIIGDVYLVNAPIKNVFKPIFVERIADSLILAGIGDVKEAERKSFVFKNELAFTIHRARAAELVAKTAAETGIEKMAEMKHRAEVAERALDKTCMCLARTYNPNGDRDLFKQHYVDVYKEEAEKELAEERKDDDLSR